MHIGESMSLELVVEEGTKDQKTVLLDERVCYIPLNAGKQCTAVALFDSKHAEITVDYQMIIKYSGKKVAKLCPAGEKFVLGPDDRATQITPMLRITLKYIENIEWDD